jgi:hydroxymethylbilane synthase
MRVLRIGSRGSQLALWQAHYVQDALRRMAGVESEIVVVKTAGDRAAQSSIGQLGLKGVFIKELEDALLGGRVDLAVHSMKDVPTDTPAALCIAAITERADVRDCLVSKKSAPLAALPAGARIGTSSLRRQAQLRNRRGDLAVVELRGNVDTRLRKVEQGELDGVVLAKAGLDRLGWSERISEVFAPEFMLPAVGQGALGIECRADDADVIRAVGALDHSTTRAALEAERSLLKQLEGGCQVPLGAWARVANGSLALDACLLSPDGTQCIRDQIGGRAEEAAVLGSMLAERLFAKGAKEILKLAGR